MTQTDERGADQAAGESDPSPMIELADQSPESMYDLFEEHG